MKGDCPALTFTVAEPLLPPKQDTLFTAEADAETLAPDVHTVAVNVFVQEFPSVTVIT